MSSLASFVLTDLLKMRCRMLPASHFSTLGSRRKVCSTGAAPPCCASAQPGHLYTRSEPLAGHRLLCASQSTLYHGRRWNHNSSRVVRSDHWLPQLPNADIVDTMFERFNLWPHHTAIECNVSGRGYTYGELQPSCLRVGAALLAGGSNPGCVAVLSHNVPEYPIIVLGTLAVGSTVTTVASQATPAEIAGQLDSSGAGAVVVSPQLESTLEQALDLMESHPLPEVFVNGPSQAGRTNLNDILLDRSSPQADRVVNCPSNTAIIPYSSGTTGKPKGVCLPHGALSNYLTCFTHPHFFPGKDATAFHQETTIGLMPFYHSFGLFVLCFSSLYTGAKIVSLPKFSPLEYAETVERHQVRVLHIVPPLLQFLAYSPLVTARHLHSVRNVLIAAAPVHPAMARAFKAKAHHDTHFQEGLGLTETLGLMVTPLSEERLGYCGKLLPNHEARVVDLQTGSDLGPDTPGELWVRGPGFLTHYHNDPLSTAESLDSDGWFKTGDVVTYTHDGFFSVVDRLKELIKVKGLQVSPSELEDLILQVEGVCEVGVVGVPDSRAGELPRAYVVVKGAPDGSTAAKQVKIEAAIHEYLGVKVAAYKQLAGGVVFLDSLPKNPTGKLLRKQLKDIK